MDFILDRIENKIEFFQAYDLKTLEKKINEQIDNNKALAARCLCHSASHCIRPECR